MRQKDLEPADGVVITGFRTALVALGAGVIAGLSLYYTHRSHQHTEKLFEHTREKDREQAELTREGQVTERYVEAIKLLSASESLTQRLGGIYSLERIMWDPEKHHGTVVHVLAAHVRQRAREGAEDLPPHATAPQEDVRAAMIVIGRRPKRDELFHLNLAGVRLHLIEAKRVQLPHAILDFADLSAADLEGADLTAAHLHKVNLSAADVNDATLTHARLGGATLLRTNLTGADLSHADLTGADLQEARMQFARPERSAPEQGQTG
ncbi:pentapeptide repeat-containing protein [Streptomyces chartreusis]